jgi:enolase 1/2/3
MQPKFPGFGPFDPFIRPPRRLSSRPMTTTMLVTNARRVEAAADAGAANTLLVKVKRAGTVTEAKEALDAAHAAGWATIVSARSGETEDVTIAHLAVGWDAGQFKVGSFARSERMAK